MDKMQAFRQAVAELGDAPPEELSWLIERRYGVRIEPRYIPLFRATVKDLDELTRLREAARAAGVGERTAGRRAADPGFRRRVAELRAEMVARALGRMADGMATAADTLRALLGADSENVRLGAARALLELGVKLRESVELQERLQALEKLVASKGAS
jgi:hypothetical protein